MKKIIMMVATLSSFWLHAQAIDRFNVPAKVEVLSSKVVLENKEGYFVLSDRSCWKVMAFSKRWRSLREWWNDVELVPKHYECLPSDWYLGSAIEIYLKAPHLMIDEANASNQDALKQCTHLLVNIGTGQVLFAIALEPAECLLQVYNEARGEGYQAGYSKGRLNSYQNSTDAYNQGHEDGYNLGHGEGYRKGLFDR